MQCLHRTPYNAPPTLGIITSSSLINKFLWFYYNAQQKIKSFKYFLKYLTYDNTSLIRKAIEETTTIMNKDIQIKHNFPLMISDQSILPELI